MTKVYGTGAYDFKRHRVAEYPVESKPGSTLPSSITLSEIQRDRLTKIAMANWSKAGDPIKSKKPFDPELVKEIYETELLIKEDQRKPVPLQRVMVLEVSQYLENYLWPNFDPQTATFEHVMSMIIMVNEKVGFWMVHICEFFVVLVFIASKLVYDYCYFTLAVSRECSGVGLLL